MFCQRKNPTCISGDLKSEDSVLEWLTDDDNRELEDEIEAVNFRMLDKLLETSSLIAVFFCMYHISPNFKHNRLRISVLCYLLTRLGNVQRFLP